MAFFRTVSFNEPMPAVAGDGVSLRVPQSAGQPRGRQVEERKGVVPALREDHVDRRRLGQREGDGAIGAHAATRAGRAIAVLRSGGVDGHRLGGRADDQRADLAYAFLIFRSDDNAMVGGLTLANIRRGVAQAGSIGYWVGAPFARQGYMTAAVRALIPFCFRTLRLHRLEAACIPGNVASVSLLEKTGFTREGYARNYLCINGIWQDHLLYARLEGDPD